jgi:hypothetical protein
MMILTLARQDSLSSLPFQPVPGYFLARKIKSSDTRVALFREAIKLPSLGAIVGTHPP